jgi:serine O-acetyltransferase
VTRKVVKLTGISIATSAEIGPGLYIGHFGGIVVGGEVVAGEN